MKFISRPNFNLAKNHLNKKNRKMGFVYQISDPFQPKHLLGKISKFTKETMKLVKSKSRKIERERRGGAMVEEKPV